MLKPCISKRFLISEILLIKSFPKFSKIIYNVRKNFYYYCHFFQAADFSLALMKPILLYYLFKEVLSQILITF